MSVIVLTFQFQLGFWLLYHYYYFEECVRTGNNNLHPVCYLLITISNRVYVFKPVYLKCAFVYATYLSFSLHRLMFKFLFKEREAAKRMFSGKRGQDNASNAKKAKT